MAVVAEMMEAELTEKFGEKGRDDAHRTAFRGGLTAGSVVLGGPRVPITKPRAIYVAGGVLVLDAYRVFTNADLPEQSSPESGAHDYDVVITPGIEQAARQHTLATSIAELART